MILLKKYCFKVIYIDVKADNTYPGHIHNGLLSAHWFVQFLVSSGSYTKTFQAVSKYS